MTAVDIPPERWRPQSEEQVQALIDDGDLRETHYFEAKREVGSTRGDRLETARDLASFAIDGGTFLVGVEEDKPTRVWRPKPQPLAGLAEKIEQIATQVVDPPLFITSTEIACKEEPSKGFLLVEIFPSSSAPHMVDGVYYGRGDRTRVRLADAEVLRFHAKRESVDAATRNLLRIERERNPIPRELRKNGFLYLVAQPLVGRRGLAQTFVREDVQAIRRFVEHDAEPHVPASIRHWAPGPSYISTCLFRAQGISVCSEPMTGPGRTLPAAYASGGRPLPSVVDVELREDGGIRIVVDRATDTYSRGAGDLIPVIMDGLAISWAYRLIYWARSISDRTGNRGGWALGLHMTNLRGLPSGAFFDGRRMVWADELSTFDADEYEEVTTAPQIELTEKPWNAVERLTGRLLRALDSTRVLKDSVSAPSDSV